MGEFWDEAEKVGKAKTPRRHDVMMAVFSLL
jgi:hypothetical protein